MTLLNFNFLSQKSTLKQMADQKQSPNKNNLIEESGLESIANNKKPLMHPNRISPFGVVLTLGSIAAMCFESTRPLAPFIYVGGALCDFGDGKVAENYSLKSKEGAKLDPLMDKIRNLTVGTYIIINEYAKDLTLTAANLASFTVDFISQRKRGPIIKQLSEAKRAIRYPETCKIDLEKKSGLRANYFGKSKTVIQSVVHTAYLTLGAYGENISNWAGIEQSKLEMYVKDGLSILLGASVVLGAIGIYKRSKS